MADPTAGNGRRRGLLPWPWNWPGLGREDMPGASWIQRLKQRFQNCFMFRIKKRIASCSSTFWLTGQSVLYQQQRTCNSLQLSWCWPATAQRHRFWKEGSSLPFKKKTRNIPTRKKASPPNQKEQHILLSEEVTSDPIMSRPFVHRWRNEKGEIKWPQILVYKHDLLTNTVPPAINAHLPPFPRIINMTKDTDDGMENLLAL